jgi:alpha-L-rhamnosidase
MRVERGIAIFAVCVMSFAGSSRAQDLPLTQMLNASRIEPLDPSRDVKAPVLESSIHKLLPEQYVWTATEKKSRKLVYVFPAITAETEPHYFRAHFRVDNVPHEATLYVAGPRSVSVWVNGEPVEKVASDTSSPLGMHVFATAVARALHAGDNVVAIEAVRGRGVTGFANSALVQQQTSGRVLVAKIVPRAEGVEAPDLIHSGPDWKSSTTAEKGWEQSGFHDADWKPVEAFGGIESNIEMYQWNADAGLYNWPGYDGISPFLAHMPLRVMSVMASYAGRGSFDGLKSLTSGDGEVVVHLPVARLTDAEAPSVTLDFGRELTGRLEIDSDSDEPMTVTVQVGESESEALKVPYLGVNQTTIPPHGTGHSPKTAFRYARVRFLGGATDLRVKSIHADHIYYPVKYEGSFESSDALLNRIWETGAYTAHLCMQDGVWDASKRDRGRWMGDTDVSGPVIEDVFADKTLLEDTLDRLLGADPKLPVDQHVNGIPGYSSFWFTGVADFYRHTGDKTFLEREHRRMLELLQVVDGEFDDRNIYANKSKVWLYVDWSPELNGDTPETRRATTLEFVRAYREAGFLLDAIGDGANAAKYRARAETVKAAAGKYLTDASGTFGPRWQTNAAAVIGGAAGPERYDAIWRDVLSKVGQMDGPGLGHGPIISPYYGDYVLRAMAEMNHREAALGWMRQFWGGMLNEGATSFWEAYDVDWYHEDFHSSLQADNRSGYFVSLAHGWSSGPTAWLMEEVLGIQSTGAGFSTVNLRPDLVDLEWARGAMPTPHGLIKVDAHKRLGTAEIVVDLPQGVVARLSVPVSGARVTAVHVNGKSVSGESAEGGARRVVVLDHAGNYVVTE